MAYDASNLSVLAYANNFTLWHYSSTDAMATIAAANYFNKSVDMMRVNDLIVINSAIGGTPVTKFYIVTGNTGTAVAITVYS